MQASDDVKHETIRGIRMRVLCHPDHGHKLYRQKGLENSIGIVIINIVLKTEREV